MTKRTKKLLKGSYYRLDDETSIKVMLDTGNEKVISGRKYGGKVYCEDLLGNRLEIPRTRFDNIERITYSPDIQTLWKLACTPMQKTCTWINRLELFFAKLIEFEHLKIRTLGYFYQKAAENKTAIGESLAYALAERFQLAFSGVRNSRTALIKSRFLAWAINPTKANRERLFLNTFINMSGESMIVELSTNRNCPVTGELFLWSCNGKAIWPTKRQLSKEEQQQNIEKLKTELARLRTRKYLSTKQISRQNFLVKIFETANGWLSAYPHTNLGKVTSFKKAYADPTTGKYPKVVVEIDVPTGKLVFANSLLDYLKDFGKEDANARENSVNHQAGRAKKAFFQARENQAFYIALSNSSPQVWQKKTKPSTLRIGRAVDEPLKNEWSYQEAKKDWNERGRICTDLWAFHAIDRSRLPETIEVDHFIVNVPPGRYRLVNNYEHEGNDSGIFCEITQCGEIQNVHKNI